MVIPPWSLFLLHIYHVSSRWQWKSKHMHTFNIKVDVGVGLARGCVCVRDYGCLLNGSIQYVFLFYRYLHSNNIAIIPEGIHIQYIFPEWKVTCFQTVLLKIRPISFMEGHLLLFSLSNNAFLCSYWQFSQATVPGFEWQCPADHLSWDWSAEVFTALAIGQQPVEVPPSGYATYIHIS